MDKCVSMQSNKAINRSFSLVKIKNKNIDSIFNYSDLKLDMS